MRVGSVSVLVVVTALAAGIVVAAVPETIDLRAIDDVAAPPMPPTSIWDEVRIEPVSSVRSGDRRGYLSGILGQSFATLDDSIYDQVPDRSGINRSVLTAGGAVGVAFERDNGRLRIEAEGRGRDDVAATYGRMIGPALDANLHWAAADGWSAMVNVWRDYTVSEHVDLYVGGGIGGGGYRYSFSGLVDGPGPIDITYGSDAQVASLAWQGGGGVIWNITQRVAFDVGYRFFSIDQADATLSASISDVPIGSIVLPQQFTASELLFSLRIYEPFRRWR